MNVTGGTPLLEGSMGVRKSIYALAAAEVEALREAYLAVMGLRDERGYQYHAGLHGLPLPIQCRHGDRLFLPWHRAYLYFFERALTDALRRSRGDDTCSAAAMFAAWR